MMMFLTVLLSIILFGCGFSDEESATKKKEHVDFQLNEREVSEQKKGSVIKEAKNDQRDPDTGQETVTSEDEALTEKQQGAVADTPEKKCGTMLFLVNLQENFDAAECSEEDPFKSQSADVTCQDGTEHKLTDPACQSPEFWLEKAEEVCAQKCNS